MVKQTIIAHEQVNEYVSNLKAVSAVGLILGHVAAKQHILVQLVKTPEPDNGDQRPPPGGKPASRNDAHTTSLVNEARFMQHARSVNRMLPGGLLISGVFLFAAENELEKEYNAARNLLTTIYSQFYAKHVTDAQVDAEAVPVHEMTVLTISKSTKRFTCKLYDSRDSKSVGRVVDIHFESLTNKWIRFNTILNVDLPMCTSWSANERGDLLVTNWNRVREMFVSEMWNERCEILVGNRVLLAHAERDSLALSRLCDVLRLRRNRPQSSTDAADAQFNVEVLSRTCSSSSDSNTKVPVKGESRATKLHLRGAIDSCAFLHDSATLLDTLFAVKFDIVRSFLSRGDLLMDEMQIAEREVLPSTIEQRLPIRIYIDNLLCRPLIYADFIFVHETYEDVLDRVRYYLDVSGNQPPSRRSDQAKANAADSASTSSSMSGSPSNSRANLLALATSSLRHSADSSFVISANQPHIHFDVETPIESSETDMEPERSVSDAPNSAAFDDVTPNRRASFDIDSLDDTETRFLDDTEPAPRERRPEQQSTASVLPSSADQHGAQILTSSTSASREPNQTSRQASSSSSRVLVVSSVLLALFAISVACYLSLFS